MPALIGGDPNVIITCQIHNDTGSDIQTIFRSQWNAMNYRQNLMTHFTAVRDASGVNFLQTLTAELRILGYNSTTNQLYPLTEWFLERFVIRDDTPGVSLLSGCNMRNELYFATAPGNLYLYVSVKKNGVVSQLPVA